MSQNKISISICCNLYLVAWLCSETSSTFHMCTWKARHEEINSKTPAQGQISHQGQQIWHGVRNGMIRRSFTHITHTLQLQLQTTLLSHTRFSVICITETFHCFKQLIFTFYSVRTSVSLKRKPKSSPQTGCLSQ